MKHTRLALSSLLFAPLFAWAEEVNLPRPDPAVAEFARGVKFTVNGYQGGEEVQTNFPVLVRLSTAIAGFDYNDFYNKSVDPTDPDSLKLVDIGFVDAETNGIPYEIDTWDPSGESLIWVNLPRMTNGTEFAMWYRSSKTGKALNPDNVWTNYAGVWHFREDYGTETASVKVYDSTTNSLTGDTIYTAGDSSGGQQPATVAASVSGGKLGRSRRMGSNYHDNNKGKGGIDVLLGSTDSAKREAVNKLTPAFSGSFWIYGENKFRYPYYVSRKKTDGSTAWGFQSRDDKADAASKFGFWSETGANNDKYRPSLTAANISQRTWAKIDFVYTAEGSTGKGYLYKNGVPVNNVSVNLFAPAVNGGDDLYIGGGSGSDTRPLIGLMDEVRLCYSVPTAARVKADFDTVDNASFLVKGTVVTNQIVERPVVNFTVADIGASHIQFGGNLSSLGSDEATECTFYAKVWPTASGEPATWTALGTDLGPGAFSGLVKGLTPATAYSYRLKVTNDEGDEGVDSYETADDFTTSGVGVSGTGGDVTRVDDDWIHYFRVGLDDEGAVTNVYTFTPPSYANSVRALVVAGGGPGGYCAGGGGGAGGYIYNAALTVTPGADYAISVGTGGVASASLTAFGSNGGSSSIVGGDVNVVAVGGGAGGNGHRNNATWNPGQNGGSGGGAAGADNVVAGTATSGQGNDGGRGATNSGNFFGGGGGGAGSSGESAFITGNNVNAPSGGSGLECDITGVATFYAGGGGAGSDELSSKSGAPGSGGSGIGGTGSRKSGGVASAATQGVDGTGSGGGGGCGDAEALYQGGDGGDGIVIIRYASQGDFTAIAEPIISLQSAVCNDTTFKGDVAFRVAWAGYGYNEVAQVKAVWGYAKTALTHTDVIATDAIGLGTGSFPLKADKRTVYVRLLAVNAAGEEAYSSEMLSFYVNENENAVEDDDMPIIANIAAEADAAWAKISGEVVSDGQASGTPKTCTVRVKYGTSAVALTTVVTTNAVAVGDITIALNGLSPNTTYYYAVEIEDDAGTKITEDTASFTTLPQPSFSDIATNVDKTQLTISGGLSVAGGGVTTVFVTWGDAEPTVFATFTKDSETTFVNTNALQTWAETVTWKVVYSNELTNADGTGNGTITTKEYSGSLSPVDTATYTWQAADGEWSGNWTNKAHWASNISCCRGYPNGANTAASFANCTTQNPAVVTIDGKYSVGAFVPNAVNGASDITFRGSGSASSGITAQTPVQYNDNANHVCSDTQIKFEEMAVTFNNDWQIMRHAQNAGGPVAYSNILVRFSNVALTTNGKQLKLCAPYSRLEFTDGTTATAKEVTVSGTDSVLLVDDSTVTASTNLRLGVQCLPNDGEAIVFRGAAPKLTTKAWFSPYTLTDQPAGVIFEVPVGGYAQTPFVFDHASHTFGQPSDDGGTVATHTFAVSPDSPALKVNATIENNVLVQTTAGFYSTVLSDSVFTVPERDGSPTGAFKWGVEGVPLAEGAELSTARQLLLNLEGAAPTPNGVMFLIY